MPTGCFGISGISRQNSPPCCPEEQNKGGILTKSAGFWSKWSKTRGEFWRRAGEILTRNVSDWVISELQWSISINEGGNLRKCMRGDIELYLMPFCAQCSYGAKNRVCSRWDFSIGVDKNPKSKSPSKLRVGSPGSRAVEIFYHFPFINWSSISPLMTVLKLPPSYKGPYNLC